MVQHYSDLCRTAHRSQACHNQLLLLVHPSSAHLFVIPGENGIVRYGRVVLERSICQIGEHTYSLAGCIQVEGPLVSRKRTTIIRQLPISRSEETNS
ncbi:hypothetical protein Mapa_001335 [Marchantia paleacea]|nr:hypothetical protein Mapa_001335 [Marchantia paleacea]